MLPSCSHFVSKDGRVAKINQDFLDQMAQTTTSFANGTLRTLLLCYKEVKTVPEEWDEV